MRVTLLMRKFHCLLSSNRQMIWWGNRAENRLMLRKHHSYNKKDYNQTVIDWQKQLTEMAIQLSSLSVLRRSLVVQPVVKSKFTKKEAVLTFVFLMNRFLIFLCIALYCAIFPILYFTGPELKWFSKTEISYAAIMYYLVFNTLMLMSVGYCIVGSVTYPYSTSYFSKSH